MQFWLICFVRKKVNKFYKNVLFTKNNFQRVQKDGIEHFPRRNPNKYIVFKMQGILKQSIEAECRTWIRVLRFFTRSGLHTCSVSSSFLFQNFGNISLHIFWGYVAGIQGQKFLLEKGTLHRITRYELHKCLMSDVRCHQNESDSPQSFNETHDLWRELEPGYWHKMVLCSHFKYCGTTTWTSRHLFVLCQLLWKRLQWNYQLKRQNWLVVELRTVFTIQQVWVLKFAFGP